MPVTSFYTPEPAFAALGDTFSDVVAPAVFADPRLVVFDQAAAASVGLEELTSTERLDAFARFEPLPDNQLSPRAIRYHGHQFRHYNPDIGDGRGFLFAQMRGRDGRLLDIGTKGSGQTPYSRAGDGRMTLQAGVREVIAARLLRAHAVPSCAVLSLVETGETLTRGDEPGPVRGAVMTRLQHSHVRIGVFQRHAAFEDTGALRQLLDHAVQHYAPDLAPDLAAGDFPGDVGGDVARDALAAGFLRHAVAVNAALAARWMVAGFVHGVLNSDNMTVTGESFDYGPFRFLPTYAPDFTAAYFDTGGLYAYARQAEATLWNLHRLAECLALIADPAPFPDVLEGFQSAYQTALAAALTDRLGVRSAGQAADLDLARAFFSALHAAQCPFEAAFYDWRGGADQALAAREGPRGFHYAAPQFDRVAELVKDHDVVKGARAHPYWSRGAPVTATIDVVRSLWRAIDEADDWAPLHRYLEEVDAFAEAVSAGARTST